jgi:hypothetical protein
MPWLPVQDAAIVNATQKMFCFDTGMKRGGLEGGGFPVASRLPGRFKADATELASK